MKLIMISDLVIFWLVNTGSEINISFNIFVKTTAFIGAFGCSIDNYLIVSIVF